MMPGLYREPASRRAPVNDPRCNPGMLQQDASGDNTPSYEYQVKCPYDQSLPYIQGRALAGEQATVVALRGQLTPQTSETTASPLRLHKLYVRAQGFAPLGG